MNFERNFDRGVGGDDAVDAGPRPRRRWPWIVAALAVIAVIAAVMAFTGKKDGTAADKPNAKQVPTVTVVVPGRQTVDRMISTTGTLAARREMPVGVQGEGGMVTAVYVEPGQWVAAGQVLATIDRAVLAQQNSQLAASVSVADANARLAQSNLERAERLVKRGFISTADVDRLTATRDAEVARVRVARAQLGESRARTGRLDIRAPAAGLVLTRATEPGMVVSSGSGALFRMAKGGEMELLARLAEGDLARMSVGLGATVTPVGTSTSFSGKIWQLAPIIDAQTRQGTVRIALPYNQALRPGGFAHASISSGSTEAPLLPESAVLSDQKGNYVYIVNPDNTVARRDVTTGGVTDTGIAVLSGLNGTEKVVLSAGAFLNPGDKVEPVRAKAAG
ncbi:RND family efflux transporter MFP subunit [Sphingomonas zeicaulis]|uniref:efflux RND transporter periplasmic adaptor subunit n=1 Tax=Sphingomonas zeicaulis TaxID=1632740 RepID=UPI003D1EF13F